MAEQKLHGFIEQNEGIPVRLAIIEELRLIHPLEASQAEMTLWIIRESILRKQHNRCIQQQPGLT